MTRYILLFLFVSIAAFGQCGPSGILVYNPVSNQMDCTAVAGAGLGSVTSVGLAGTANQITVTGASPITDSGSWTLSFPAGGVTLPGTTMGTFSGNITGNVTGNASGTAATITGLLGSANLAKQDVMDAPSFCADAGSTDAYACNLSPAITGYVTGTHYRFKANTANTGAATIAFNSLASPKTIVKVAGGITTALADNDIRAGQWVDIVYDGTNMQLQSTLGNVAGGDSPGAPDTSLQYRVNATTFGGMPSSFDRTFVNPATIDLGITNPQDDLTTGGSYTDGLANPGEYFGVEVNTPGSPDTFDWTKHGAGGATNIPMTECPTTTTLSDGVTVCFASTTGHTHGEGWTFWTGKTTIGDNGYDVSFIAAPRTATTVTMSPLAVDDNGYLTSARIHGLFYDPPFNTPYIQMSDNSGVSGHLGSFSANGTLIDSGVAVSSLATFPADSAGALTNDGAGALTWQPSGQTPCTFATLGTVLTVAGQSCYCSDCDLTSGANNTCASGTGPAVATLIGSTNACFQ